jgi:hypothetical protein
MPADKVWAAFGKTQNGEKFFRVKMTVLKNFVLDTHGKFPQVHGFPLRSHFASSGAFPD